MSDLKVLLVNFHSSRNAGDAALLEASLIQLREAFNQPHLIVSANYPKEDYLSNLNIEVVPSPDALISIHRWKFLQVFSFIIGLISSLIIRVMGQGWLLIVHPKWRPLLKTYQQVDLVVGCPGNQYFSMGRFGWPLFVSGFSVFLAHLFGKPFYVLPQSSGPFNRWWEKRLMKWLYGRARLVLLRERGSLLLLKNLGIPSSNLRYIPDPAFSLPASSPRDSRNKLFPESPSSIRENGAIGVTAITRMVRTLDAERFEPYYQSMAGVLRFMVEKYGVKIVFFPQVTGPTKKEDDRIAAEIIAGKMREIRDNLILLDQPCAPGTLKSLYSQMDIFIASRLHSGIFSLSMNVPTLFIGYLTKTRYILETLDLQEWLVELENLDETQLLRKLEILWLQRKEIQFKLKAMMPEIIQESRLAGGLIAQDYYNGRD
jgi:colanic acid/amylovoran biosynthesis protein